MHRIWSQCLKKIESELNRQSFETWIKPTRLVSLENGEATVAVPNRLFREWIEENYSEIISSSISSVMGRRLSVKFVVDSHASDVEEPPTEEYATSEGVRRRDYVPPPFLNAKYTFDNFIVGASNQFAHAASMAVADMPARAYNPLFIYGGVGLGKTHLLHAIGHHILSRTRGVRISYVSCERFVNELIRSLRQDCMDEFRSRYRSIDVLLIDDIHFMAGKDRTQEEFFHTFNELFESHRQIVLSADSLPRDIRGLQERLRNRFEWGLIADIQAPDLETKIAILQHKAKGLNIRLPTDVAHLIAGRVQSNIRELEGCLLRISAYSSITGRPIDLAMAQEVLEKIFAIKERRITIDAIQKAVAKAFGVRVSDLKGKKRVRSISLPRQVAMYIARNHTKASLPEIGRQFGGKDHTTVIHSYNKIEKLVKTDKDLERQIREILKQLESS
jgi:chromosomal replication initiator protein